MDNIAPFPQLRPGWHERGERTKAADDAAAILPGLVKSLWIILLDIDAYHAAVKRGAPK